MRLKDIAEKTGYSLTTVSRVINKDENFSVSKETEELIWNCARELGYDKAKKRETSLKKKSTMKKIGYILTVTKEKFEDSCFATIIHGIEREAIDNKCSINFAYSATDLENSLIMKTVMESEVDGLILIGNMPKDLLRQLVSHFSNIISIFDAPLEETLDCVTVEYEQPFYELTRKLIEMGRTNIAYIGGETYKRSIEEGGPIFDHKDERFQGYLKALMDYHVPIKQELVRNGHWDIEIAYNKKKELLDSGQTIHAVEAAGDKMALGVMRAIQERGLRIPQDISVIGFDNIETTNYVNPRLTTVNYPKEELGRMAVRMLAENIMGKNLMKGKKVIFPSEIIERDSVCPLISET